MRDPFPKLDSTGLDPVDEILRHYHQPLTHLRERMSERALAARLGISRRQVRNRIEVEAKSDEAIFPIEGGSLKPTPPTMTRAEAIAALTELAESPEGLTAEDVHAYAQAVYGRDAEGKSKAERWHRDGLRKAACKGGGLYLPRWIDKHRAGSQRRAMIAGLSTIQQLITDTTFDLIQRFPGADYSSLQAELVAMLAGDRRNPIEAHLRNLKAYAQAAVDRFGDAGEHLVDAVEDDAELTELCL